MKLFLSLTILAVGLAVGWFYLRRPPLSGSRHAHQRDDRPWRRVGAGICVVLAVMFVLGIYLLDGEHKPGVYIAYWLVMMLLVLWLCVLVLKDVLYTRQLIAKWKAEVKGKLTGDGTEVSCGETDR